MKIPVLLTNIGVKIKKNTVYFEVVFVERVFSECENKTSPAKSTGYGPEEHV